MKNVLKKILIIIFFILILFFVFNVKIQTIDVRNNTKSTDTEIINQMFKREFDKRSIVLFINEKVGRHKKMKYVKSYSVSWNSPKSIVINVIENPSIAYVRSDLKRVYFDKDGIINEITDEIKSNLMEVEGISFKSYEKGDYISSQNNEIISAILEITSTVYEKSIPASLLEIMPDNTLKLYVENIIVILGDVGNMEVKLQRLYDIYKEISEYSGVLDLSNAKENMLDEQYIFKKN